MLEFLKSILQFFQGVTKRVYFWLWAVLDQFDAYNAFKPEDWPNSQELGIPDMIGSWVLWGIASLAVLLTYHEVRDKHRIATIKPKPNMSITDAVRYLAHHSVLICSNDQAFDRLKTQLFDALRMGHVIAFGRPTIGTHGVIPLDFDNPLQQIKPDEWNDLILNLREILVEHEPNRREIFVFDRRRKKKAYYDILLDSEQLKAEFPKASIIRRIFRKKYQPVIIVQLTVVPIGQPSPPQLPASIESEKRQ